MALVPMAAHLTSARFYATLILFTQKKKECDIAVDGDPGKPMTPLSFHAGDSARVHAPCVYGGFADGRLFAYPQKPNAVPQPDPSGAGLFGAAVL